MSLQLQDLIRFCEPFSLIPSVLGTREEDRGWAENRIISNNWRLEGVYDLVGGVDAYGCLKPAWGTLRKCAECKIIAEKVWLASSS